MRLLFTIVISILTVSSYAQDIPGCTDPSACNYINSDSIVGFNENYSPSEWTQFSGNGNGTISFSEDGNSLVINGSDGDFSNWGGSITGEELSSPTEVYMYVDQDVEVSFDWSAQHNDTWQYEQMYFINGTATSLINPVGENPQSGTITFNASAGDLIGFIEDATNGCCGEGWLTISNFIVTSVGEPANVDDGSCEYTSCADDCGVPNGDNSTCSGCSDPNAYNYDPTYLFDNDSCTVLDCYTGILEVEFEKLGGTDWNLPENQDFITPTCIITRQNNNALYNSVYQNDFNDNQSGSNTMWKNGSYDEGGSWYNNIKDAHGGNMQSIEGDVMTLHILDSDLYFELDFSSWDQNGNWQQFAGGFAYTRTFIGGGEDANCNEVEMVYGCSDEIACNYDTLATYNDGSCEYISCADLCGVPNGDNSSCTGCTDPIAFNYDPNAIISDSCTANTCFEGQSYVEFEKENYADWNLAENQDFITSTCIITRQNQNALYNSVYQNDFWDNQSGSNTMWKNGGYNEGGSWYNNIRDAHGNNMQSIEGDVMTLHILDSDLYFELYFTSWSQYQQGGFAYTRTFITAGENEDCFEVELVGGCTDDYACNYDSLANVNDGTCDYISCADICGVPNGDNSSCTGCTNPSAANYDAENIIDDGSCTSLDCGFELLYNGPTVVNFEKADNAYWNLAENRDFITPTCEITRQNQNALYNSVYQNDFWDNQSGSNTMWKNGAYNEGGDWYNNIRDAHGYNMQNIVGDVMTLHILDSDLYFELYFTSWSQNQQGGFAYTRTFIAQGDSLIEGCIEVELVSGCTDQIACNYDSTATVESGLCEFTSCADECGVPNGDNSTCTDCSGVVNGDDTSCNDECGVPNGDNSTCLGCTDPNAFNYDPTAIIDNDSCTTLDCFDGELEVDFEKENGADWNLAENQDFITPTCIITRQNNRALYNYVYQNDFYDNQSGSNTLWKNGAYSESGSWYNNIRDAHGYNMQNIVGDIMTLHVLDADLYYELYFTSWSQSQQGGFAYTRTFVAAGENADCEEIELINGCTDELACNYDSLATFNDGTCDFISCLDECGVLFGDNSSCIGCTDPNAANYDPANIVDDGSCTSLDCGLELLYNGPTVVYFEKEDNAYWNIAENRDIITPTCEITRQSNHALYNHVYQGDFWDNQGGSNTLWKNGTYNEGGDWYNNIRDAHGYNMQNIVGDIMTLHILDSDLYFELEFTSWTSNGAPWNNNSDESGGFAYIRTFIAQGDSLVEGCVEVELVYGCTDELACNYDSTATVESGFCEYISCADECGVPNGDNSTCTDCSGVVNGDDTSCYDECGVPNGDNSTCSGCTDSNAFNYDPNALIDDSTCTVLDCFNGQIEIDFEKFDGTDWNLAENQDFITPTCIITRQDNQALYNSVYQNDFYDNQSESNTMWKMGSYEMAGTWYNNIRDAHGYNMQNIVGDIMTLHILDSDLYFELEFTSWTSNGAPWFGSISSGGFAYTRTFIGGGENADCEEVNMIYGCTDAIACNFDSLATYNDGSCDYLSCADDCGIPNGDNSSCSGCMDPSAMNYDPTATISDNSCSVLDCDFELNYGSNLIIDFEKENGADWNLSENQDSITPSCIITRQNNRALYNYVYQNDFWDNQSGSNTEWKNGAYNEGGSWYNNIRDAHGGQMQNVVGNTMTLHILDSDLYFELYFTSWSQNQQGGFAYTRTLIAQGDSLVENCDEIIIDGMYGCIDEFACNYDSIASLNDGSCEYISCADDCGVPNGDNSSCTGCMDPIAINYSSINIFDDSSCTILDCDFELTYFGSPLVVDFEKASNADWNLSENQDSITPTCIITRQNMQPLYNTVYQNNYWDNQQNGNIQWKMGSYEEDNNWYFNLRDASNNNMQNIVGETVTLHILDSDLYFELYFTAWSQGWSGGGGFAYTRTFVAQGDNLTEDCEEVLLVYGCTDEVACNYNSLSTFNDGSCEYISCADECGVPNGDNSTCTDCSGVVNGDDDSCFDDCGVLYGDNTSCIGCTDSNAYNYDPTAIISNDSCTVLECYQGGLIVNFEKEDNSNYNLAENQDFITPTCIITRQNQSALYNTVYQDNFWDNQIGSNTEWKMGGFDEENSWYNNIRDASNNNMQNIVGETVTLHILDSDLYFELYFTAWTQGINGGGGGFAYTRTLVYSGTNIDEDANCNEVALIYGCSDPNSCNFDSIATFNDGSCDYSCYDACGVIYGDNSSCSGCMDPSASNYDPNAIVSDDSCADLDCEIDINYDGLITTSFEKEDGADWTLAENQDSITPNCILTRQNQEAIYNIVYQDNFYDNQSGSNTYWKNGPLSSGGGWYNNIRDAHDGQMQTIVGDVMTLHILDADLYFELTFTSWSQNQQGGFAYTRTLVASGSYFLEDCEEVIIDGIYGCTDEIACNFDAIATLEDGTCEYESCADDCGEPNGNNESCSGCMDPFAYNYDPTAIFDDGSCSTIECDFDLNYQGLIVVQFEKEDGADWNLSANRDSITPTCIITRQDNQALYNAVYQDDFWDNQANSNMYWKNGSFDENSAWYNNIRDAHNGNMQTIVGDIMTLHILDDDLYFEFEFTSWTSGGSPWNSSSELSGGFAYTRTLIAQGSDLIEDCDEVVNEIEGCTDILACNYNEIATFDNSSCIYAVECEECSGETDGTGTIVDLDSDDDGVCDADEIVGCTDVLACNYNEFATDSDTTCVYAVGCEECSGETDGTGTIVDLDSDDDGVCDADEIVGCTDVLACNYNEIATDDDSSCIYTVGCEECSGETNGTGTIVDLDSDDDGVCDADEIVGCTDVLACNYNEFATDSDTTCVYAVGCEECSGETDGTGTIVDLDSDDDGVCDADEIVGCTDVLACNYNEFATDSDTTCVYAVGCEECSGETNGTGTIVDLDSDDDGVCDADEIVGCTDVLSCNYNEFATDSDTTCVYAVGCEECSGETDGTGTIVDLDSDDDGVCDADEILGCTDVLACNYNEFATDSDTTCVYAVGCEECSGETDGTGTIVDLDSDDDGVCDADEIVGCTDVLACNYNEFATDSDTTCIYAVGCEECSGESDGTGTIVELDSDDDGVCDADEIVGCTDVLACNYNEIATDDDSSCIYTVGCEECSGETDGTGTVIDVDSDDDGVCDADEILGCTDTNADNYNPNATEENNSCSYCSQFSVVMMGVTDASEFGASDGNAQAIGYGGSSNYDANVFDANGIPQNPFALSAGDYTFVITDIISNCTAQVTFTVGQPDNVSPCDFVPTGLTVDNIIHNRVTFNWSATDAAPSHYMIRYRVLGSGADGWTVISAGPVNTNSWNGTSRTRYFMEPGTTYEWSMRARVLNEDLTINCQSDWSANFEYTTLPACPNLDNLSVSAEANWVTFFADAPSGEWGVWQSKGKMRELGTNSYRYVNGETDGNINGLKGNFTASTDYEWHTKAWCTGNVDEDGNSDPMYHSGWGDFSAFSTEAACDKMPMNLTTSSNGANTAVIMSWDTPESGAPDHYFLEMTNVTTGAVYEWNDIPGTATSQTKFNQNPGDEISWRIRGACGTNGTSWATIFSQPVTYTLGGERVAADLVSGLDVYPNPSRDIFNVTFTSEEAQTMSVKVVNMIGEEIYNEELIEFVGQYTKVIDMNTQPKGVYFLEITTSTGGINKKIVLQ